MSEHIKQALYQQLNNHFDESGLRSGQILAARFDRSEFADFLADGIYESGNAGTETISVGGYDNDVTTLSHDGVTLLVQRIFADTDYPGDDREINGLQGFGTALRNFVAEGEHEEYATFLIIDNNSDLDTYKPTERLTDVGGPLNLAEVRDNLLTFDKGHSIAQKALLSATRRYLENEIDTAGGSSSLRETAAIRSAINYEDIYAVGSTMGSLPELLELDTLPNEWFDMEFDDEQIGSDTDYSELQDLYNIIEDAHKHAGILHQAFRGGENKREKLREYYKENLVSDAIHKTTWTEFTYSDIKENKRVVHVDSEEDGEEQNGGSNGEDGDNDDESLDPADAELDQVSIEVSGGSSRQVAQHDSPITKADFRWSAVCSENSSELDIAFDFDRDIQDADRHIRVRPSDVESTNTISGNNIEVTVEPTSARPSYIRIEIYLGRTNARGHPRGQLDVAILPDWCYQALEETEIDIEFNTGALFSTETNQLTLTPQPPRSKLDTEAIQVVRERTNNDDDDIVYYDSPIVIDHPIKLQPRVPHDAIQLNTTIQGPSEEIDDANSDNEPQSTSVLLIFHDTAAEIESRSVAFPLFLEAIASESLVSGEDSVQLSDAVSVDSDSGEITANGRSFTPEKTDLITANLIEEEMISDQSIAPRSVPDRHLQVGTTIELSSELPDDLRQAYDQLFEHFDDRETTPSSDSWDAETKDRVRSVINEYLSVDWASNSRSFCRDMQRIGTIECDADEDQIWQTSFHPLMLSYGYRLAEWRDNQLVPNNKTKGFENRRFTGQLDPSGLLPYKSIEANSPLRGDQLSNHSLWSVYSPVSAQQSQQSGKTPEWLRSVTEDRLYDFVVTFEEIFQLHPDRELTVNLVNLGDLAPVVQGLCDLYNRITTSNEVNVSPPVELRIHGDGSQGTALDDFFSEHAASDLEEELTSNFDEGLIQRVQKQVSYSHREKPAQGIDEAHISIFRDVLESEYNTQNLNSLPNGLFKQGLIPTKSLETPYEEGAGNYITGFSCGDREDHILYKVARQANLVEANTLIGADYTAKQKITHQIRAEQGSAFRALADNSVWAVHIEPTLSPDFFIRAAGDESIVIQYSDEHDSSSPGYDVITTTNRRSAYREAIRKGASRIDQHNVADTDPILSALAAVKGDAVTELQHQDPNRIKEQIGEIGGLALARSVLRQFSPEQSWIPIPLAGHVQHDRARRGEVNGVLYYDMEGPLSDDLLYVGIPDDLSDPIRLWIVEAKGGSSADTNYGAQQIVNARTALEEKFHPSEGYADTELLYSAFGRIILGTASRMHGYDLVDEDERDAVTNKAAALNEGDYEIAFQTGVNGTLGDVINVVDSADDDFWLSENVRISRVPIQVIDLLSNSSRDLSSLLNFNLNDLRFESLSTENE